MKIQLTPIIGTFDIQDIFGTIIGVVIMWGVTGIINHCWAKKNNF